MVDFIKFSEFANGGDLSNNKTTVGLDGSTNTRFNNPWTFLAPGATGDRPVPDPTMYFRIRFNTTLEVYEYYDPTTATWTQLSGSGTGTVNPGVANDLAYYAVDGQIISPINGANDSVLITGGTGIPALSTTLPSGLTIPGATITTSTAALLSGSVIAAPVAGVDITNKTYVDNLVGGTVLSITGTANQVIASSPTGHVTLSLPQDIATGSTPTFQGLTLTTTPLAVPSGGTGKDTFTAYSVICAGTTATGAFQNVSGVGSANQVLVSNGAGVLPTWQSVPGVVPAALTKTDDTNVTLSLGGTPATSLLQAVSLTLGWTGTLSGTRGGTGVNNGANTATFAGNLNFASSFTTSGAFAVTQTYTGITNVTFPTSGTLLTSSSAVTSITGTSSQITASASTGAVTLAIASNPVLPGTGGVTLPTGNIAQRAGIAGTMRFNSQTSVFEGTVDGSAWAAFETSLTGVLSVSGTLNRITSTGGVTPVIDISASYIGQSSITTLGTIGTGLWNGSVISEIYGGTNQSSYTLGDILYASSANTLSKLSGNTTSVKQYLSQTGTGAVSAAPSWATITGSDITGAALTKTDDTNVTLTLGGSPTTALLRASSLALGWTGQLGVTRGGSGLASATAYAVLCGGTTSTGAFQSIASVGTAGQVLTSNGAGALPTMQTAASGVVNIQQAAKTDTQTISTTTLTDITGLSIAITPSSSSSLVLVICTVTMGQVATQAADFLLLRNSTPIFIGDAAGSRAQVSTGNGNGSGATAEATVISFLDSPATTSAVTYKIQARGRSSTTFYINRTDTDTNASTFSRYASSIVVMEVKQ